MAPDFPYFIRLTDTSHYGHTFAGLFYFCLPVGLAVLGLWHWFLKRPLLALAPMHLSYRITEDDLRYRFGGARHMFWIVVSLWIGAALHVLWDAFTHAHGIFVEWWPVLRIGASSGMPVFSALQALSSVLGLLALAWAYWRWARHTPPCEKPVMPPLSSAARLILFLAGTAIILAVGIYEGSTASVQFPERRRMEVFLVKMLIATITAGFLEMLLFSAWWHLRKNKAPALSASTEAYKIKEQLPE